MRTTIDLPDALLDQAKDLAARAGHTVRELVIEGLGDVVARRLAAAGASYHLPDRSVAGQGLQSGMGDLRWDGLHELVHDDAGRWTPR